MKTIILRDDDTSAFTTPRHLETLYGRLWDKGIPISLGVIPAQHSDVKILRRSGNPCDPAIAKAQRGHATSHPITDNPELIAFLTEKAAAGLVEICLHGYEHRYMEFMTSDTAKIQTMLTKKYFRRLFLILILKPSLRPMIASLRLPFMKS
ncbi:MAG: DUF2334 domain-containing protein [Aggregatilineales bacterium]